MIVTAGDALAAKVRAMAPTSASPVAVIRERDALVLTRGHLRVEVKDRPFRVHVRRAGHRLVRGLHVWACEGTVEDRFVRHTEGVVAKESRGFPERTVASSVRAERDDGVLLDLVLQGGRTATLSIALPGDEHVVLEAAAAGEPLRIALEWDTRTGERFAGLGARHALDVDHRGRAIQLGADRWYTGPSCPPDLLEIGGIPQGDYAPVPFLQSSRGVAVALETFGNGTRFDLGARRDATVASVRARSGPLRAHLFTAPGPAARLRAELRRTGMPQRLPAWAYGFWKSRDVHEHQDQVLEDATGCAWHGIPLDAIVLDSPWETNYNTWIPNPHQFPDFEGMVGALRARGVRTVVWVTPWTNVDSRDGQIPPDPGSRRLHREPASNYAAGEREGHFVREADRRPLVRKWWMGTGSPIDFTSPEAERWWREQAQRVLRMGVSGIKADDGEGYYLDDDVRFADGTTGATTAWRWGELYRRCMRRALDEVHPGDGVLFGRSGWSGQQAHGILWGGDQASDFWSLQALVASTVSAASSGFSNWSHDVGGYLGDRGIDRCPAELLLRWAQLGTFTPLMQAHGRLPQEPWNYDRTTLERYRGCVVLHEMLVPYIRASAETAARCGLPIVRPLSLIAPEVPEAWAVADAFGFGPSLWVAPVLEEGAREREAILPPGRWIETWSGREVRGGREVVVPAPLDTIPVWVRAGHIVVTHPAEHVARGLGDTPDAARPYVATLWGRPPCGRALARLPDGTRVRWSRAGGWAVSSPDGRPRDVRFAQR